MKINQCFKDHQVISFEVFPPRKNASNIALTPILNTLDAVKEADPDFVSVTFGANGKMLALTTFLLYAVIYPKAAALVTIFPMPVI